MLMRFWQVLVMAGLSMIVARALLGVDLPVRTNGLQEMVLAHLWKHQRFPA